jgi:hypothetical protein
MVMGIDYMRWTEDYCLGKGVLRLRCERHPSGA